MILTYDQRQQFWEWCREFIDREAIYRVDDTHPMLPGKNPKGKLYFPVLSAPRHLQPTFCPCARPAVLGPLRRAASTSTRSRFARPSRPARRSAPPSRQRRQVLGIPVNVFQARREPKGFGLDNWFNGRVLPGLPVLMVEDIAASAPFLLRAAIRVQQKLKLPLHRNYFTIVNKVGLGFKKENQHTENYLDGELVALFTFNNFCKHAEEFAWKHGHKQNWTGIVA